MKVEITMDGWNMMERVRGALSSGEGRGGLALGIEHKGGENDAWREHDGRYHSSVCHGRQQNSGFELKRVGSMAPNVGV